MSLLQKLLVHNLEMESAQHPCAIMPGSSDGTSFTIHRQGLAFNTLGHTQLCNYHAIPSWTLSEITGACTMSQYASGIKVLS